MDALLGINFCFFLCSLANIDPVDVARNISGLNPETTLGSCSNLSTNSLS